MKNNKKLPIRLAAVPKETIWGGTRLKENYNKTANFPQIAESWELTVRKDGENTALNAPFKGQKLSDIIKESKTDFLGTACTDTERFPLLIKFIDAKEDLSVQVHPNNEYSLLHENEYGKTEMWYVAEADEGAQLVLGLKAGCSIKDLSDSLQKGDLESKLNFVKVKKGDVFFIPPGLVHAIGRGILIAEIQQNSNVTYRVYDYNRKQSDGTLRPLHIHKALDVVEFFTDDEIKKMQFSKYTCDPSVLCSCQYFCVRKIEGEHTNLHVSQKSFAHVLVLNAANAFLKHKNSYYAIAKGDSWFLPAGIGDISVEGTVEFLITTLP